MCGRYFFADDIEVKDIYRSLGKRYGEDTLKQWKHSGEITPGNVVLTINSQGQPALMRWGYSLFNRNIINTRLESITEKNYYREDFRQNRCLIVASGFFEWDENKNKYYITAENSPFYLAGLYQKTENLEGFSIITREATQTKAIHSRCPIVMDKVSGAQYLNKVNLDLLRELEAKLTWTNTSQALM